MKNISLNSLRQTHSTCAFQRKLSFGKNPADVAVEDLFLTFFFAIAVALSFAVFIRFYFKL